MRLIQDIVMDIVVPILITVAVLLIIFVIGLELVSDYKNRNSPTVTLKKVEWACTEFRGSKCSQWSQQP